MIERASERERKKEREKEEEEEEERRKSVEEAHLDSVTVQYRSTG